MRLMQMRESPYKNAISEGIFHVRPYPLENSGSRPLSHEKPMRANPVVGSVTTSESLVLYVSFFFFFVALSSPNLDMWDDASAAP